MKRASLMLYCLTCLWVFSGLVSCKADKKNNLSNSNVSTGLLVDVFVVEPRPLTHQLITTANLLAYEEVEIKAPVSGTVMAIHFKEGQQVRTGQSLIQIDDRLWKAQIKGLKARLTAAKSELKRNEALFQVEGVSQEAAEQSKASVEELEARIEELSVYVELANIRAPFTGNLGMRSFSLGTYLTQGQIITKLAQTDKLKLEFDLSSANLTQVALGDKLWVVSLPDTVEASVYAIDPVVSTLSRTLKVRALIAHNTKSLIPGDFVEVIVGGSSEAKALAVPTDAIVPELGRQTLFVLKEGKAVKREIVLGARTPAMAEVIQGVSSGDTVLTTGLIQVRDQMPVRIRHIVSSQAL